MSNTKTNLVTNTVTKPVANMGVMDAVNLVMSQTAGEVSKMDKIVHFIFKQFVKSCVENEPDTGQIKLLSDAVKEMRKHSNPAFSTAAGAFSGYNKSITNLIGIRFRANDWEPATIERANVAQFLSELSKPDSDRDYSKAAKSAHFTQNVVQDVFSQNWVQRILDWSNPVSNPATGPRIDPVERSIVAFALGKQKDSDQIAIDQLFKTPQRPSMSQLTELKGKINLSEPNWATVV